MPNPNSDVEYQVKTLTVLPMKHKLAELMDCGFAWSTKCLAMGKHGFWSSVCQTPNVARKNNLPADIGFLVTPSSSQRDQYGKLQVVFLADNNDTHHLDTPSCQMTLGSTWSTARELRKGDIRLSSSAVSKAPTSTVPSSYNQFTTSFCCIHMCPEPRRSTELLANVKTRQFMSEFRNHYDGIHGTWRDRQFTYSRFWPWRSCRDDFALLAYSFRWRLLLDCNGEPFWWAQNFWFRKWEYRGN